MDFFDLLVGLETDLWNTVEHELLRSDEVGLATLSALRVLHRHGGEGRVHDVSADLSITVGAASKLVDRLERAGLATRRPHPDDRRSSLVVLTDAGESARRSAERVAKRVLGDLLGDGADVAVAMPALSRIRSRIKASREGAVA